MMGFGGLGDHKDVSRWARTMRPLARVAVCASHGTTARDAVKTNP